MPAAGQAPETDSLAFLGIDAGAAPEIGQHEANTAVSYCFGIIYLTRNETKSTADRGAKKSDEKNTNASLSEIDENMLLVRWPELVEAVKIVKPTLFNFLKEARIVDVECNIVTLAFSENDSFQFNQISKNKEEIERLLSEKFGELLKINLTAESPAPKENRKEEGKAEGDPAVRSVLDAFDGELL